MGKIEERVSDIQGSRGFSTSTSTFYYVGRIRKDIAPTEQNVKNM